MRNALALALTSVVFSANLAAQPLALPDTESCIIKLAKIMSEFPEERIRSSFRERLSTGGLYPYCDEQGGMGEDVGGLTTASFRMLREKTMGWLPVLVANPRFIDYPQRESVYLSIGHEHTHIIQLSEGRVERKYFMPFTLEELQMFSQEEARMYLEMELEAYFDEVLLAEKMDWLDVAQDGTAFRDGGLLAVARQVALRLERMPMLARYSADARAWAAAYVPKYVAQHRK